MSISNNEILQMAEVVSREKELDKEIIFVAIEAALATAIKKLHPDDIEVRVNIHRNTGKYDTYRVWDVIEDSEENLYPDRQIALTDARKDTPQLNVGDQIEELMQEVNFGRIAAQAAKQVIMQKVREAKRNQIAERYEGKVGELVSGLVRRVDHGNAIIDLGDAEAILPKNEMINREGLRPGDRIRALLKIIDTEARGPQLILTRVSPEFLIKLFKLEVPEVGEGIIEILGAARDPGSRSKIAVKSNDSTIDPVGACVGIRGSRVQSVSNEIAGEKVDIIVHSENLGEFVIQALAPAEIESIYIDDSKESMDVVVTEENLSRAIGRGGQNVRLASELTGWELNLMSESEALEKQDEEMHLLVAQFMAQLDIDENVAGILAQENFASLEEIAYVPKNELMDIEEFDEDLVNELRSRARDSLLRNTFADEGEGIPSEDLLKLEGMNPELAIALAKSGIRTSEDLAECAVDEVLEVVNISEEDAGKLIMTARAPWFAE
ncbi:MAG: transcription termination factor NusA [Gammaproteobacteria bacterium]|nr:transcription termination factor NusA [Gammaproteobacteria bacterium]MCY4274767.1 transcription termination factor NusA [Gammaproteobacteria bacterium]